MRHALFLLLAASTLSLTACSKSDEEVLVSECVRDGGSEAYCECSANVMAQHTPPATYDKLVSSIRDGKTQDEAIDALPTAEQVQLLALFPALMGCPAE